MNCYANACFKHLNVMNKQELLDKLFKFSVSIVLLVNKLPKSPAGYAISNQIVRSGTSITANCEEAQDAISKKDFIKSITIALKEAKETKYWLRLLLESKMSTDKQINSLLDECSQIIAILVKSVKTLKGKT